MPTTSFWMPEPFSAGGKISKVELSFCHPIDLQAGESSGFGYRTNDSLPDGRIALQLTKRHENRVGLSPQLMTGSHGIMESPRISDFRKPHPATCASRFGYLRRGKKAHFRIRPPDEYTYFRRGSKHISGASESKGSKSWIFEPSKHISGASKSKGP
jgi:hypothetical protein